MKKTKQRLLKEFEEKFNQGAFGRYPRSVVRNFFSQSLGTMREETLEEVNREANRYLLDSLFPQLKITVFEITAKLKSDSQVNDKYIIEESHKYEGCYNVYDRKTGSMVKYFAEDDDKNYKRAVEWVKSNPQERE